MRWWWLILFKTLLVHLVNSKSNSIAYKFGKNGGSIIFNYADNNRPDTKLDQIELTFLTYTNNCTLIRVSSKLSNDFIAIGLLNGVPTANYNLGFETHIISFNKFTQVNDGSFHRLRFIRFGQNSTLQLDSNLTINLHPKTTFGFKQKTIFNSHSRIRLGGSNDLFLLNLPSPYEYIKENKNKIFYHIQQQYQNSINKHQQNNHQTYYLKPNFPKDNNYDSQAKSNLFLNKIRKNHLDKHFEGILMNVVVNKLRILDMALNDNPSVILNGDVQFLVTKKNAFNLLFSTNYQNLSLSQPKASSIKKTSIKSFHKKNVQNTTLSQEKQKEKKLIKNNYPFHDMMQNDQPINEQTNYENKINNKNFPQANFDEDDLIFSGSSCYDDEDECANYIDTGSAYDDLITPVYVPIKPTPISKLENNLNTHKQSNKYSTNNEDDDDNDDDDENTEENGSGSEAVSNSDDETTENQFNSNNNLPESANNLYPIENHFTEQSNKINSVTIDDDDRSILFTSQPIPPPEGEIESMNELTSKRPIILPKRPTGHIEIVKLPLPSEPVLPKPTNNQINRGNLGKIKFNSIDYNQYNNINSNVNLDDNSNLPELNNDILGSIHMNRNLNELKFSKTSADRTAIIIAIIAILIIFIVIIAPIIIFIKMRIRMKRNLKLNGVTKSQINYQQHQPINKSYASLAASGSMHHTLGASNASTNGLPSNTINYLTNSNFNSNMQLAGALGSGLALATSTNPIYGTVDKSHKLFKKKDSGKEWYV